MNLQEKKNLWDAFQTHFNGSPRLFFSPSRINIIGEHIDYNGGKVLPAAIEIGTYAFAATNDLGLLRLVSLNLPLKKEISLDDLIYREENGWTNFVVGMIDQLNRAGYRIGGLDIVVYGNIPNGAGLSSSASLELLIGEIGNVLYHDGQIPMLELVSMGKRCENEFIGVQSGIMDQFAIGMGKKDHAILLDTQTLAYEYVKVNVKDHVFVILNTDKRRELKDSKYNERRSECDRALDILKETLPMETLCEIDAEEPAIQTLPSPLRERVLHVTAENHRVYQMIDAMTRGDIQKMGQLLSESHESLRDLYQVTGFELDRLVHHADQHPYCAGARMVGAGFGGCAIALVKRSRVEDFFLSVTKGYRDDTGRDAGFYPSVCGDGTRELEV